MATVTATRRRRSVLDPMQLPTRGRRPPRSRPSREQTLADARAREVRARNELAKAFAGVARTYALAVRNLEEFNAYLNGVRQRLQKAGYLVPVGPRGPVGGRVRAGLGERGGEALVSLHRPGERTAWVKTKNPGYWRRPFEIEAMKKKIARLW